MSEETDSLRELIGHVEDVQVEVEDMELDRDYKGAVIRLMDEARDDLAEALKILSHSPDDDG